MAPKRKEKERAEVVANKSSAKVNIEAAEAEKPNGAVIPSTQQGLLPKAFERPTQLYRFLRERHQVSPLFLHRTLTYMRGRMSRDHKTRKSFKVDNIFLNKPDTITENTEKYMTLTFLGFFDKSHIIIGDKDTVKVEVSVWKTCHNRRKDLNTPGIKLAIMTIEVPINPSDDSSQQVPILSIPPETINVQNLSRTIKSYSLTVRVVRETPGDEPQSKDTKKSFMEGSLFIYNSKTSCLLNNGDYEVLLHQGKRPRHNRAVWMPVGNIDDEDVFSPLENGPAIMFRLDWTLAPKSGWVNRPELHKEETVYGDNKENRPTKGKKVGTRAVRSSCRYTRLGNSSRKLSQGDGAGDTSLRSPVTIEFRFVYSLTPTVNQSVSTTFEDFRCPWCYINCMGMYPLLKHLRLFHARFNYICNPRTETSGYQINVTVNETFDGKYEGSPLDMVMQPPSTNFSRDGPIHRTPVTQVLVFKPKRPRPSLAEFLETEENSEPVDLQRPFVTGHGRLYHHTTTNMPVYPREMDQDSEGEKDPKWLRQKTVMMIDDFTDVNEGEKELMKMWNLHVMKWGYVGDCQLPMAHSMFIKANGKSLLRKNLYRNFMLHLCNTHDFHLLPPPLVHQICMEIQELLSQDPDAISITKIGWLLDRSGWLLSGGAGGSRDKSGKGFSLSVHKSEHTHPKMASSSTFISGDGTLRRKMTQQTPQSVKKPRGAAAAAAAAAASMPNGASKAALEKHKIKEDEEESKIDVTQTSGSSQERGMRSKRKLSLQDKLGGPPAKIKRSGSLPTDAAAPNFRRKCYVSVMRKVSDQ